MKKTIFAIASVITLASCQRQKTLPATIPAGLISVDSANKMVQSYINSINFAANDSDVRSFSISAAELRYLLDSTNNSGGIVDLQIRLAHTLSYINSGKGNINAGYNKNALTLVIAGVDVAGNTVLASGKIVNHGRPCPANCPPGNAGNPIY